MVAQLAQAVFVKGEHCEHESEDLSYIPGEGGSDTDEWLNCTYDMSLSSTRQELPRCVFNGIHWKGNHILCCSNLSSPFRSVDDVSGPGLCGVCRILGNLVENYPTSLTPHPCMVPIGVPASMRTRTQTVNLLCIFNDSSALMALVLSLWFFVKKKKLMLQLFFYLILMYR